MLINEYKKLKDDTNNIFCAPAAITKNKYGGVGGVEDNVVYKIWTTFVFVSVHNYKELLSSVINTGNDNDKLFKMIGAFNKLILGILEDLSNCIEIGYSDCGVYAAYYSPTKSNEFAILSNVAKINTSLDALNSLYEKKDLPQIKAGIGMDTDEMIMFKASDRPKLENSNVWIGQANGQAYELSMSTKGEAKNIAISSNSYSNFIEILKTKTPDDNPESWFSERYLNGNKYYTVSLINNALKKAFRE